MSYKTFGAVVSVIALLYSSLMFALYKPFITCHNCKTDLLRLIVPPFLGDQLKRDVHPLQSAVAGDEQPAYVSIAGSGNFPHKRDGETSATMSTTTTGVTVLEPTRASTPSPTHGIQTPTHGTHSPTHSPLPSSPPPGIPFNIIIAASVTGGVIILVVIILMIVKYIARRRSKSAPLFARGRDGYDADEGYLHVDTSYRPHRSDEDWTPSQKDSRNGRGEIDDSGSVDAQWAEVGLGGDPDERRQSWFRRISAGLKRMGTYH